MQKRRRSPVTTVRVWARQNVVTSVLVIFIIFSTILNALTIGAVYRVRTVLRAQLETAVRNVGEVRQQTVHYEFPIQQSFPISTTIDLNETLDVPINMSVPIREQIMVPVGPIEFPVDLNFDVPISMTVPVEIDRQIPIRTMVDLDTSITLQLDLGQPPLGDVLQRLEETMRDLLDQL